MRGRSSTLRTLWWLTENSLSPIGSSPPITRTTRGIRSEVEIGPEEGLPEPCVISCDNIITVPVDDFDRQPVGRLDEGKRAELDRALRYALDILY